jgi:two-component system, LuxR family, response regulator FixJ
MERGNFPAVFVVDDDAAVRDSLEALLSAEGFQVRTFDSAVSFLAADLSKFQGCLLLDVRMPKMSGLELQQELRKRACTLPVVIMTGHADVQMAVAAMKAGAVDFIEKPFDDHQLIGVVRRALAEVARQSDAAAIKADAALRLAELTAREREVLDHLVAGCSNKVIAQKLGISPRTVEIHRAHVMEKMRVASLSELVRLALRAEIEPRD